VYSGIGCALERKQKLIKIAWKTLVQLNI